MEIPLLLLLQQVVRGHHLISSTVREIQIIRPGVAKGLLGNGHKTHFQIYFLGLLYDMHGLLELYRPSGAYTVVRLKT